MSYDTLRNMLTANADTRQLKIMQLDVDHQAPADPAIVTIYPSATNDGRGRTAIIVQYEARWERYSQGEGGWEMQESQACYSPYPPTIMD